MSGGTEKLQYYVSGSYLNQNGNLRYGNDNLKRYNLSAKINTKINRIVEFNLSTKFIRSDLDNPVYLEEGGLLYHDHCPYVADDAFPGPQRTLYAQRKTGTAHRRRPCEDT